MIDCDTVVVLVTTYNRPELLKKRALESILNQTRHHDVIVLVDNSDAEATRRKNKSTFHELFEDGVYLVNQRAPGAAGTWNQGLQYIKQHHPSAWVAILDDDDEWTPDHLQTCLSVAKGADAVISGIRTVLDGEVIEDRVPTKLTISDFFATNPGWQGSNTFIRSTAIHKAGWFDEDLLCTHDRDLAIRCLSMDDFKLQYSERVTMRYHLERKRDSLTMTQGKGKHTGLLQFYKKHRQNMTRSDEEAFFKRSRELFGLDDAYFKITNTALDTPGFPVLPPVNKHSYRTRIRKAIHFLKKRWWKLRTRKRVTKLLGRQFVRTRELIEIDLTYACNLRCHDCNRSCRQAPDGLELRLEQVREFVDESLARSISWKKIRLLGGEPTLHSEFEEVLYELGRYKFSFPTCRLEVVTNGFGRTVKRMLLRVPPFFHIENTMKESDVQPQFYAFNLAPADKKGASKIDFTNGCSNIEQCGIGLTPSGYYPCAIAGGIDRVANLNLGRASIPASDDDMLDLLNEFCRLCGRFESRVFTPPELTTSSSPGRMSASWERIYDEWQARRESS